MTDSRRAAVGQRGPRPEEAWGGAPEVVRVDMLGGFRVSVGSRVVGEGGWRLRKAASLVKLLALCPDHHLHRERVMDLLWPGLDMKAAANNLHQALHAARRVLGAPRYLRLRDERLLLCPEAPCLVDTETFEEAAKAARRSWEPAACEAAIGLYAGDLLPDDSYETWAEERREGLRRTYLSLLVEMAGLYEQRDDFAPAFEALRRAVSSEPAHEEVHAGLMHLYARTGQRQAALRQYEQLRSVLRQELDAEPGAEIERLYQEILAGRVPPAETPAATSPLREAPPGRHNLPASLTSFVGRGREVAEVRQLLSATRLLTLTGVGGCGKTRLALEAARGLAYPDEVWLVELAPLSEGALAPQAVAEALGVREQANRPLAGTLVDALRQKKALLVLDNCEHLVDAAARLAEELLISCPELRVLATSREALGVAGEVSWQVPPLSLPAAGVSPDDLTRYEATRLFVERARQELPAFASSEEDVRAVADICRKLEGIPLAVELAAARVGTLSAAQISERLSDSLTLLTGGARTAPPRQQTLRGTLDWGYELLAEAEKKLLGRLPVFAGGWTLEAAEAVGTGDGIEEGEVLDLLSRLVDKSLVVAEAGGEGALRYRFLEPVRQYAREKLEESGEAEMTRRRHAAYFLSIAEEAELTGAGQEAWLGRLETEHDNLRAALGGFLAARTVPGAAESALRLAGALGEFWHVRGHLGEGRRWLETALASAADPASRIKALNAGGWISWEQLDYERAAALSEEALALAREFEDEAEAATALYNLGMAAMSRNEPDEAGPPLEEAARLWRALGDEVGLAHALQGLGLAAVSRHDHERATTLFEEVLPLVRKNEDGFGIMLALGLGALAALSRGDHEQVGQLCAEGLSVSRRLGIVRGIFHHLHILAALAGARGQPVRAARLWGATEAMGEELGIDLVPVERHFYGPYIEAARERLDEAAWEAARAEGRSMPLEQAVEYAQSEEIPNPRFARARALAWASWMAWEQGGDLERAKALGEEHLALSRELGDAAGVASALFNLGVAALRQDELGRASVLLQEALAIQRELEDAAGVARSLQALGLVAVVRGEHDRAAALFEEGLALTRRMEDQIWTVLLLGLGALVALGRKDHRRAGARGAEGLKLSRRLGLRHGVVFMLHVLAALAGAQKRPVRAARLWGASEALGEEISISLVPVERRHYGPYIAAAREGLDEAAWEAAWAEGRSMSWEEAVEYVLSGEEPRAVPPEEPAGLTRREQEVATLVARGLTDRRISAELSISERTVHGHVRNILGKLGLRSRAQIAAWVTERGLGGPA